MTYEFLFWFFMLLYLLSLLGWGYGIRTGEGYWRFAPYGGGWLVFVLMVLIGLKLFGGPIHG